MWEFHDRNLSSQTSAVWSDSRISPRCTANVRNISWCSQRDVSEKTTRSSALILSTCRCGELFFLPQWADSEKTTQMWEFLMYSLVICAIPLHFTNIKDIEVTSKGHIYVFYCWVTSMYRSLRTKNHQKVNKLFFNHNLKWQNCERLQEGVKTNFPNNFGTWNSLF